MVVAPRWFTRLKGPGRLPLGREVWQDTSIGLAGLPPGAAYRNVFTGGATPVVPQGPALSLASALATFPVALLEPAAL